MCSFFSEAFGFIENDFGPEEIKNKFVVTVNQDNSVRILSKVNNKEFHVGRFEVLNIEELSPRINMEKIEKMNLGQMTLEHISGVPVQSLIKSKPGAVFQVASQFNMLEMVSPSIKPDRGITGYQYDGTQGPACAISCPAGTLFRNYFYNGKGQCGSIENQIDGLWEVGEILGNNESNKYWTMVNGYCLASSVESIKEVSKRLSTEQGLIEKVRNKLRVFSQLGRNAAVIKKNLSIIGWDSLEYSSWSFGFRTPSLPGM